MATLYGIQGGQTPLYTPTLTHYATIRRLLWFSLAIPFASLICSLLYLGVLSFWITPITFLFSTVYSITLLVKLRLEQNTHRQGAHNVPKGSTSETDSTRRLTDHEHANELEPRSIVTHPATAGCAWALSALWFACFGIVLGVSISAAVGGRGSHRRVPLILVGGYVEAMWNATESGIMAVLAVYCRRERKERGFQVGMDIDMSHRVGRSGGIGMGVLGGVSTQVQHMPMYQLERPI